MHNKMEIFSSFSPVSTQRTIWCSLEARQAWEPVIKQAKALVAELEVLSVVEGHRPCSWQTVNEKSLTEYMDKWSDLGLYGLPVKRVGVFSGFAHRHINPPEDKLASVCVVLSKKPELLVTFKNALKENDNKTQGRLLGFPSCCCEFFSDSWKNGFIDPIWQMALNTEGHKDIAQNRIMIEKEFCDPLSNPILRYLGARFGFHIPHSFKCKDTIIEGKKRYGLSKLVNNDLTKNIFDLLSMPMSWDLYRGIAIIRTPIFYIEVASIMTLDRFVVEINQDFIPEEGVKGFVFPFNKVV